MTADAYRDALSRRLIHRTAVSGRLVVPAVPALVDDQVAMCAQAFAALGRPFSDDELAQLREVLREQSEAAFAASPRANVVITYEAGASALLSWFVEPALTTPEETYAQWVTTREGPLFGTHPDARVSAVLAELEGSRRLRILDVGAGTGRNSLPPARRGHAVDAVEVTPAFAEAIRTSASAERLAVRVVEWDVFAAGDVLRSDYDLVVASELVTDLRGVDELRDLFALAAGRLVTGGRLVCNAFVTRPGCDPDEPARQLGQQLYTSIFTREDLAVAVDGLPLRLVADDLVLSYEEAHLPPEAWPPTTWYVDWARGQDLYDVAAEDGPLELRWLVYERTESPPAAV